MTEPKRKRPRATLEQKIKILDFYHSSNKLQLETVEAFKDEVAISTLTFNEWVKKEDYYRKLYSTLACKNQRRTTKFKYEKINRAMDLLLKQRLERGEPITEPILRDYWQVYAHQFGVENPKRLCLFSHGWLNQFKKRHGISHSRRGGGSEAKDGSVAVSDVTTSSFNKKLLTNAVPESSEIVTAPKIIEVPTKYAPEPVGLFRPQKSLNFALPYPRLSDGPSETPSPANGPMDESVTSSLYGSAMSKTTEPKIISSGEFEQFLLTVAVSFFQKNQYQYPQTMKLFQDFKSSFISERLISLRSGQDGFMEAHNPQTHPTTIHHHHIHLANHNIEDSVIIENSISPINQSEMSNTEYATRQNARLEHATQQHVLSGHGSQQHTRLEHSNQQHTRPNQQHARLEHSNQQPTRLEHSNQQNRLDHVYNSNAHLEISQATSHELQLGRTPRTEYDMEGREKGASNSMAHALVSNSHHGRMRPNDATRVDYEEQALRNSQKLLKKRKVEEQRVLQRHAFQRQSQMQQATRGRHELHELQELTDTPTDSQSRLPIQKLPRLPSTDPIGSPLLMRTVSSPGLAAALSIVAPFSNSREDRNGLDEMFSRPSSTKQPCYNNDPQWSNKSELQKMWEQNKITLS